MLIDMVATNVTVTNVTTTLTTTGTGSTSTSTPTIGISDTNGVFNNEQMCHFGPSVRIPHEFGIVVFVVVGSCGYQKGTHFL